MTKEEIIKLINDVVSSEGNAREYSGRCMYGKKCLGVTCEKPLETLSTIIFNVIDGCVGGCDFTDIGWDDVGSAQKIMENVKFDNLGRDYILYFPDIPYIGEKDD
jgi:hypothetical protein